MDSDPTPDPDAPGDDRLARASVTWPTPRQLGGQLAAVVATLVLWGGLFWGAMHLPTSADVEMASGATARREARRRQADTTVVRIDDAAETSAEVDTTPPPADPVRQAGAAVTPPPKERAGSGSAPTPSPSEGASAAKAVDANPTRTTAASGAQASAPEPAQLPVQPEEDDPLAELMEDAAGLGEVSFATDVFPLLERRCVKCHGGERDEGGQRIEEGLSMLSWEDIMAGSTWGSVVEPGDVAGSYLLELIQNGDMPDKEPRLLPREVRVITQWIATGAKKN